MSNIVGVKDNPDFMIFFKSISLLFSPQLSAETYFYLKNRNYLKREFMKLFLLYNYLEVTLFFEITNVFSP